MKKKNLINEDIDIHVAERRNLNVKNFKFKKYFLFVAFFLILFFPFIGFAFKSNLKINFSEVSNVKKIVNNDLSILGHLPYKEISKEKLVRSGRYFVFLSGYRSINLQKDIFYSLKSMRNQIAAERARVSAPPGYSEHSTGFAIDIGDAYNRETDFKVEFENTDAFRWLKKNAAKYHFKLSFNKNNKTVDYEPWHWRYEGSIEALKVFEASNRNLKNAIK